ncbi:flagellin [Clostridium chromiireducens]|uniref:Flagellin n=1 Tax=Clostridium chromiireducens TaxID=225345 RepID=A0A399IT59_9CLOT|nr:flagellin [Clostridium chromiireducens]RII36194.1 flagellin [Clostridium chromiireducens]
MIINHNMNAMNAQRNSAMNTVAAGKSMEKLSSGLRINRAGDDAAGLSISEKMRSQIRGLDQAARNAQDGISLIQTAEGGLNEVSDMLVRMKELAVQKANTGTYSTADIANVNSEMNALSSEINNIFTNTMFNGAQAMSAATIVIDDRGTTLTIAAATLTKALAATASTAATAIDTAIDGVNTQRASYGALQNRLEHIVNNLGTTTENLQASESRIRDVDMAKEMMKFSKNNILSQAAQAMLAQANQQPQGVLQLLR